MSDNVDVAQVIFLAIIEDILQHDLIIENVGMKTPSMVAQVEHVHFISKRSILRAKGFPVVGHAKESV